MNSSDESFFNSGRGKRATSSAPQAQVICPIISASGVFWQMRKSRRCWPYLKLPSAHGSVVPPGCGALFWVCSHCDRGQCYCSQACREEARRQQRRAANRRYQRTEPGRQAHLLPQRAYRHRQSQSCVTDHGSRSITATSVVIPPGPPRCVICGRRSHWIDPFHRFRPRRRHPWAGGRVGRSPKEYVFR